MKERISSLITPIWTTVFPIIWIAGIIFPMFFQYKLETETNIWGIIFSVLVLILLYFTVMRARVVYIDNDYIIINRRTQEIKIPIQEIEEVQEKKLLTSRAVFVKFSSKHKFGEKIMFIPKMEFFQPILSEHPIVSKLVARANMKSCDSVTGETKSSPQ